MNWPEFIRTHQRRFRFCLSIVFCVCLLALIFEQWQPLFGKGYLYPVSYAAALLLEQLGVQVELDASSIPLGFCILKLGKITFRIIYECTGIFTLFIFLAAVLAYPASIVQKGWGWMLGIPAFFAYSSLRLVILGLVAHRVPEWIPFFHLY